MPVHGVARERSCLRLRRLTEEIEYTEALLEGGSEGDYSGSSQGEPDDPRKGKYAIMDMKSWILCLLASSPEYIDGISSNYIAMAWPRDSSFHGSAMRVSARVSDLVDRELISLAQIHAASLRSNRFDVRSIDGSRRAAELAEEFFPEDPQVSYWVSCVYSEPRLYDMMWPDEYSPKGPPGLRSQLPQVLTHVHATLSEAAKGGGGGERADSIIQSRIDSAVSSLGTTRRLGEGNISAVTIALSSLCHSGQRGAFGLADVLSYLQRITGWAPPEKPWGSLPELYGSECWLSIS